MKRYPALLNLFYNRPHAMLAEKLWEISQVLDMRHRGIELPRMSDFTVYVYDPSTGETSEQTTEHKKRDEIPPHFVAVDDGETFTTRNAARSRATTASGEGNLIAVVPLFGTMMQHADLFTEWSGGTSTTRLGQDLRKFDADPDIGAIVLEVHSPGGQIFGTEELADVVREIAAGDRTRIVAVANSMAASAAVWVATQAEEFVSTQGGWIGSIGVVVIHTDFSGAEEQAGIKTTLVATPAKKAEGNPYEPLGEDVRAEIERDNDKAYAKFRGAVARGRGVTAQTVDEEFGGGGMLLADDAVSAGLVDRIATIDRVIGDLRAELAAGQNDAGRRRGQGNRNRLRLAELEGGIGDLDGAA